MTHLARTYDLTELPGIVGYVEGVLLHDIRTAFAKNSRILSFGVALGAVTNGTKLPRPQPMVCGGKNTRSVKRSLRTLARNSHAAGAIFVYVADEPMTVVVQLEHRVHGDHVWTARIVKSELREFEYTADITTAPARVEPSRFMAARYMS